VVEELAPDYAGCVLKEIQTPDPGPGEVLVETRAAAVNFPDLLQTRGEYQHKPPLPFIPGLEMAGVVAKVGDGVTRWKVGDAVAGGARIGGFSEMALTFAQGLRPKPKHLSFGQAAGFGAAYLTAYVSLVRRAQVEPNEWVLVHGAAGGVGLACVDLAKLLGCRVIAASASDAKLAVIDAEYAPDATVNVTGGFRERVKEITGGRGADVIYDPVGGEAFDVSLRCVAPEGRLIPMGFASGTIPQIPANILLVKNVTVIGFYYGYWNGWGGKTEPTPKEAAALAKRRAMVMAAQDEMMRWYTEGKLKALVAGSYDLADWVKAFKLIEDRTVVGKAVLVP
jgi:NADPH2:quinone reductase